MKLDPDILEATFTDKGEDLYSLISNKPVLLVFLRHFGCTFCREAMTDIAKIKNEIVKLGITPVLVHMSKEETAVDVFEKYELSELSHISDPDLSLYEYFGLSKGNFSQLYGLKTWIRGLKAGMIDGHGSPVISKSFGDYNQMPGMFILKEGMLLARFNYKSAADRPDYLGFIKKYIKK